MNPKGKYAWTATVGEKGQIVIPKQAREVFGIRPGDTLLLLGDEKRGIAIPPKGEFAALFEIAFREDALRETDGCKSDCREMDASGTDSRETGGGGQ